MRIKWRAGNRVWINRKSLDGYDIPTGIVLAGGNNEELDGVDVRSDDGQQHRVDKRSIWMVKYTIAGG